MQNKEEVEAAAQKLVDSGLAEWAVSPMSDVLVEIVPADHPFITKSYPIKTSDLNPEPKGYDNPWVDRGHVVLFGRACLRFGLDEQSLVDHISFLQNILSELRDLNDPNQPGTLETDHRRVLSQKNLFPENFKRYTEEQDIAELQGDAAVEQSVTIAPKFDG